jgi:hypothetical protein
MPSAQNPLSSDVSKRHGSEGLLDLCRLRFDFDIRQRLRSLCAFPINNPPHESFLSGNSHHVLGAVVRNRSALHAVLTAAELRKFRENASADTDAVAGPAFLRSELLN